MDLCLKIDRELSRHNESYADDTSENLLTEHKFGLIAQGYAEIENLLVVLSDLQRRDSHIFHSRFSALLALKGQRQNEIIMSIWEQDILQAIYPDDLEAKLLNELSFLQYLKTQPKSKRFDYCLCQKLRMRDKSGNYLDVLHRQHYLPANRHGSIRFALCLYGPLDIKTGARAWLIDKTDGRQITFGQSPANKILSRQETAVLKLIEQGKKSREIAQYLNVSVHTISRHRQNIIAKLQVRNSIEACRIAKRLGIF